MAFDCQSVYSLYSPNIQKKRNYRALVPCDVRQYGPVPAFRIGGRNAKHLPSLVALYPPNNQLAIDDTAVDVPSGGVRLGVPEIMPVVNVYLTKMQGFASHRTPSSHLVGGSITLAVPR